MAKLLLEEEVRMRVRLVPTPVLSVTKELFDPKQVEFICVTGVQELEVSKLRAGGAHVYLSSAYRSS